VQQYNFVFFFYLFSLYNFFYYHLIVILYL